MVVVLIWASMLYTYKRTTPNTSRQSYFIEVQWHIYEVLCPPSKIFAAAQGDLLRQFKQICGLSN